MNAAAPHHSAKRRFSASAPWDTFDPEERRQVRVR